jgi:uncharacterized membrane protein YfcA
MPGSTYIFIAAVFALAGMVKGAIGLGLPTIAMGLLAVAVTPLQAAAILVLPSFLTNIWQAATGPYLKPLVRRLWPMLVGICLGTWAGAGLMTGPFARYGTLFLGVALMVYAGLGLGAWRLKIDNPYEPWLGPLVGAITGIIAAATGVFVIPAVPYLQAISLEKDELVQALGLSFTVSSVALTVNVAWAGALDLSVAGPTIGALATACAGMWAGQVLRSRMQPASFQRWFFFGLLLLGAYLAARTLGEWVTNMPT